MNLANNLIYMQPVGEWAKLNFTKTFITSARFAFVKQSLER